MKRRDFITKSITAGVVAGSSFPLLAQQEEIKDVTETGATNARSMQGVSKMASGNMPMNIPMHRFKYTNLTKEQIVQKLKAANNGPTSVSELSDILSGKSFKIVTDKELTLDYEFKDKNRLTFSENGGAKIQVGYGALTIKQGVIFSHVVPDALKGYNVYIDLETELVTVFEVWFAGGIPVSRGGAVVEDREVQREFYFGYREMAGKTPSETRHHLTNRIEGKGVHWTQDTGIETLEFYASVASVNFVELTRHADYLSYCSPSDYVKLNDNMFIHSRSECEFSGIYTMFILDMFTPVTQAGVRLGFNEKDELEYYMFRGEGEIVGQIAALEPFNEHGHNGMMGSAPITSNASPSPARPLPAPTKGQRTVYRPARTLPQMTDEEVHQAALKNTAIFDEGPSETPQMMAVNTLPFTDKLVGKEFTLRYDNDGPVRHYRFKEKFKLSYRDDKDNRWIEADYRAYEGDEQLFWFSHLLIDSKPRASVQIAIDFTNGLTTCIYSRMGTPYYGNETTYRAFFGVMEMPGIIAPMYIRHEHTYDLVGQAISWSYSDQMTSMHLFASPHSMSWTIFTNNQTRGSQWSSPCIMIKLRPMIYIFCQNEEACNGAEMCELFNLKIMRGCGFGFQGGPNGVKLELVGALGRKIGQYDIAKFFGPKAR